MSGETEIYRALLEMSTEALWVTNSDGEFEAVNSAFVDLTGYSEAEVLGRALGELFGTDGQSWGHRVELLTEPGATEQWFGQIRSKSGTEVPVQHECEVIEKGRQTYVVGRIEDLRTENQQEQKLNVLNRALRHNIRNQVNVILGKASMLQEIDDEGYRTAAAKIEEIGQEIINISDKARRAQQHIGVPFDDACRIDLVGPAEQAIRSFRIAEPSVTVETEFPAQAPARAPPSLDAALQELLENAVVHSAGENAEVAVEIEIDDDRTHVHVRDQCEPIPAAVRETIGRGSEQPLHHNDGLGLWIVQWITDTVDGKLTFDRRGDDSGNVVTLTFETLEQEILIDSLDSDEIR